MKKFICILFIMFNGAQVILVQAQKKEVKDFRFFNRSELFYSFGFEDTYPGDKTNALHIKTVLGVANQKIGFGFGIENGSYRTANGSYGASFNTLSFSGNMHYLVKPMVDEGTNYFIKGGLGYAVAIFNGYDKGLNTEAATGIILTNKRKRKYFLEGVYFTQQFDNYTNKPKVKSIGLGIGSWF